MSLGPDAPPCPPPPGNFSVPVYIRTCHRPSCTVRGTSSPWTNIDLQGACCKGQLCNRDAISQSYEAAAGSAPGRTPQAAALVLAALLALAPGGLRALFP